MDIIGGYSMPGSSFGPGKVDIIDEDQLPAWCDWYDNEFYKLATNLRGPLEMAETALGAANAQHILTGMSPDGSQMAPLALSTIKNKGHNRPLIEEGDLLSSLVGGPGHVENVTDTYMSTGTSDPIAAFQEYGTSRIPARPFMGIPSYADELIGELILDHIIGGLKNANCPIKSRGGAGGGRGRRKRGK